MVKNQPSKDPESQLLSALAGFPFYITYMIKVHKNENRPAHSQIAAYDQSLNFQILMTEGRRPGALEPTNQSINH